MQVKQITDFFLIVCLYLYSCWRSNYREGGGGGMAITTNRSNPPHGCICPKPKPGFLASYIKVFLCSKVVREYRQRKKEIGQLEKDLANRQQALDGHQEEIEKAKKDWLEPLQNLIEKINENFSYFFSCMSCAGEVDLNIPDNAVSIIYGKKGGEKGKQ